MTDQKALNAAVMAYLKVISQNSHGEAEKNWRASVKIANRDLFTR
jgi:hypothetical protein